MAEVNISQLNPKYMFCPPSAVVMSECDSLNLK